MTLPIENNDQISVIPKFQKDKEGNWFIGPVKDIKCTKQTMGNIFGSQDIDAVEYLMIQLMRAIEPNTKDKAYSALNQVTPLIKAIAPQDELEGMLAIQMIGIHNMAMEMMKRAMLSEQTIDGVNLNVNRIAKLTRTFIAQLKALDKHRGRGQQKITVEHVTVNEGGQAIVGNVEQGGRDEPEK